MTKPESQFPLDDLDQLTIEERQQIEQLCDQFEDQWKQDSSPYLSTFADRLPARIRPLGLRELVILEIHYRKTSSTLADHETQVDGASCASWEDFVEQFPELASVAKPDTLDDEPSTATLGDRFQRDRFYAAGGLGRVSIAHDLQFDREVAIKEMRGSLVDQPQLRKRFLREAQITGGLEHPCIVPVYASGTDENGAPYYAMRLIEGPTLRDAIAQIHQSDNWDEVEFRGLLIRFVEICRAVAYAHEKGVIHRDIKPQNIVVGAYGETLLIDWGLARKDGLPDSVSAQSLAAESGDALQTREGAVMGTPPYMSPEQSRSPQVGPPADIFSLGATLLHIVTGKPPGTANQEIGNGNLIPAILRRPLQAICEKAMRTDPDVRYESATALADDIEKALADQTITALRDSLSSRFRRWSKRNRSITVAATVAGFLLVLSLTGFAWITKQHAGELTEKNRQLDLSVQQETKARRDAEDSEQLTNDALNYWINALRSPDPDRDGREIKVVEILDQAASRLEEDFIDQPLALARMSSTISRTYNGLGLPTKALPLAEQAHQIFLENVGPRDLRTVDAAYLLSGIYEDLNDKRAKPMMDAVVTLNLELRGRDHPETLVVLSNNAMSQARRGETKQAIEKLLELEPDFERTFGPEDKRTYSFKNNLANAYHLSGDFRNAIHISRAVYDRRRESLGDEALTTIVNGSNYVVHLLNSPQRDDAIPVLEHLLNVSRNALGDDHPQTLINMNRLGFCYSRQNKKEQAIALIEEALRRRRELYGDGHPAVLQSANSLGTLYIDTGQFEKAATQLKKVYDASIEQRGADNADTLTLGNNLASAYRLLGNNATAIELFREILDGQRKTLGVGHLYSIRTMINLASVYQQDSQLEKAEKLIVETCELAEEHLGLKHPMTQTAWSVAGSIHLSLNKYDPARDFFQRCFDSRSKTMPNHWLRFHTQSQLGHTILKLGDPESAEPLLLAGYEGMLQREQTMIARAKSRLADGRARLVELYEKLGNQAKADSYRVGNAIQKSPDDD